MAPRSRHSCPTCRHRFRDDGHGPIYLNDPMCSEHCPGGAAESVIPDTASEVASAVASAVVTAVASAIASEDGPAGADIVVQASTGARSRNPTIFLDNGDVLQPADDDSEIPSSIVSVPSLESVDEDYVESETTVLYGNTREASADDIARSIRHLFNAELADENTSPSVLHAMAEADASLPPTLHQDEDRERTIARLTTERAGMMVELAALERNLQEVRRLWDAAKAQLSSLVTDFDACIRELTSAYIEDVEGAATFTRQNSFNLNNLRLRQGNVPQQRRAFDRTLNVMRGHLDGRHDGHIRFDSYNSRADGAVMNSHPVQRHRYLQRAPSNYQQGVISRHPVTRIEGNLGGFAVWPERNFHAQDYPMVRVSSSVPRGGRQPPRGRNDGRGSQDVRVRSSTRHRSQSPEVVYLDRVPIGRRIRRDSFGSPAGRRLRQGDRAAPVDRQQRRGSSVGHQRYSESRGNRGGRQQSRQDARGDQSARQLRQDDRGGRGGRMQRQDARGGRGSRQRGTGANRSGSQPATGQRGPNQCVEDAARRVDVVRNRVANVRRSLDARQPSMASSRNAARVVQALGDPEEVPQVDAAEGPSNPSVATPDVEGDGASVHSDADLDELLDVILQNV